MNKDLTSSLAWAGGIIVLALGASFARQQGAIDTDTTTRVVMVAIGLMVAWFGNRMPKTFVPSTRARQATRVTGWSMALGGLVNAGFWLFAPLDVAVIGGCGAILLGMAVAFGYCLSLRGPSEA